MFSLSNKVCKPDYDIGYVTTIVIQSLVVTLLVFAIITAFAFSLTVNAKVYEDSELSFHDNAYVKIPDYIYQNEEADLLFEVYHRGDFREVNIQPCIHLPLLFDRCEPSICYIQAPFGKIYRKIIGPQGKFCLYIERSDAMGGVNCEVPLNQIPGFSERLHNLSYDDSLTSEKMSISNKQLFRDYRNYCTFLTIGDLLPIKQINAQEEADIFGRADDFEVAEESQEKSEKELSELYAAPALKANLSLAYSAKELELIENSIAQASNRDNIKITRNALTLQNGSKLRSLHLGSILYFDPTHWTIWLNNVRLTENSQMANLSILRINKDEIQVRWQVNNLEQISPNWRNKLQRISPSEYESIDRKIYIRQDGGKKFFVVFLLHPNQTIELSNMTILEGKLE